MNLGSDIESNENRFDLNNYESALYGAEQQAREEYEALEEIKAYPFSNMDEVGATLSKYNGAMRIMVEEMIDMGIIKSSKKLLTVIKTMEKEASVIPSHGLMVKKGSRKDYVHLVLELNPTVFVGIFLYDSKRMLSVPQVHNVERLVQICGLKGAVIVANNIGIPARQEAHRINSEQQGPGIVTIEHYDSIEKRFLGIE